MLKFYVHWPRKEKFYRIANLTVLSLFIFEVVSVVKENELIQAHQQGYITKNRNINPFNRYTL